MRMQRQTFGWRAIMWEWVLNLVVSVAATGGLVVFVLKTWIKKSIHHEYDRKLEAMKSQHTIDLERIRSDLTIAVNEHYIRFSKLHEKRAEVVAQTYGRMLKLRDAVADYTRTIVRDIDPPLPERRNAVQEALNDFHQYFFPNEIYLPENTAAAVKDLREKLYRVSREWYLLNEDEKRFAGDSSPLYERWQKESEPLLNEMGPLFETIRKQFQGLIEGSAGGPDVTRPGREATGGAVHAKA